MTNSVPYMSMSLDGLITGPRRPGQRPREWRPPGGDMNGRRDEASISKVWLVTGSSRGLGRALVEVALEAGDRVVAAARRPERLQDVRDKYGDSVLLLRLDVCDGDAAARAVAQAHETFGRIDVVVNNAGYSDLASLEDTTDDSFRRQIDTNFYGVVNVSKAAVPVLREQGSGHIFQVSSLSVRVSAPGLTAYHAWATRSSSSTTARRLWSRGDGPASCRPGGP
jgi:NAD(P)-dependent dehydrogenase (short-subunit alcohol dehydrogenase family)